MFPSDLTSSKWNESTITWKNAPNQEYFDVWNGAGASSTPNSTMEGGKNTWDISDAGFNYFLHQMAFSIRISRSPLFFGNSLSYVTSSKSTEPPKLTVEYSLPNLHSNPTQIRVMN